MPKERHAYLTTKNRLQFFWTKIIPQKPQPRCCPTEVLALSDSKEPRFGPRSQQLRFKTYPEYDLGHPRLVPTLS